MSTSIVCAGERGVTTSVKVDRTDSYVSNVADAQSAPVEAFVATPDVPPELDELLSPLARRALTTMMNYFHGDAVRQTLIEDADISGNLVDVAPVVPVEAARPDGAAPRGQKSLLRNLAFRRLRLVARQQGSVRALVELNVPNIDQLTQASIDATDATIASNADSDLARAIGEVTDRELGKLSGTQHRVIHTYWSVPFVALELSEGALDVLEQSDGILGIARDHLSEPLLDQSVPKIGADVTRDEGLDGTGFYVAVLDSGVLASHDMFAGKEIVQACFALSDSGTGGDCPNGSAVDTDSPDAARPYSSNFEGYDHGTHVAGIACGSDPNPGLVDSDGLWRFNGLYGVAPGAGLIAVQVFHPVNDCSSLRGRDSRLQNRGCVLSWSSDQVAALQHVYGLRTNYNIASVNMSLGGGKFDDQATCDSQNAAVKAAIDNLRSVGIATVIASGNDGYCDGISGPGCISSAVAVGATTNFDNQASFSNYHDALLDLYAPGQGIRSAVGTADNAYGNKSGTSMATPHVAGAWAVLKQASPALGVGAALNALQSTGQSVNGPCGGVPSQKRIQIDDAVPLHDGRLATNGTGDTQVDMLWTSFPGGFFTARRFLESESHTSRYFYESLLEPPVLNIEVVVRNDSPDTWASYQVSMTGADFGSLTPGDALSPLARAEDPVEQQVGLTGDGILLLDRSGRDGFVSVLSSHIDRDGENATLTINFADPVEPGEAFLLAYFVRDVGQIDKGYTMVSTPLQ